VPPRCLALACWTVPHYRANATEDDYLHLRAAMEDLAAGGPFDATDALTYAVERGLTSNAGDVAAMLGDMADLGDLRHVPCAAGSPAQRFELAT
jgi:hypothetical protein